MSADLAARSQEAKDATAAAILDALSMIADDPDLTDQVDGLIDDRTDAPHALHQAIEGYRAMLTEAGGYLAERAPTWTTSATAPSRSRSGCRCRASPTPATRSCWPPTTCRPPTPRASTPAACSRS